MMKLDLYTTLMSALPFLAILISVISLFLTIKDRRGTRQALLLSKRSDLVERIAQNQAKLESLITVYLQQKEILWRKTELPKNAIELPRVNAGLTSSMERAELYRKKWSDTQATPAIGLARLQEQLAAENVYLAGVSEELTREQDALKRLLEAK